MDDFFPQAYSSKHVTEHRINCFICLCLLNNTFLYKIFMKGMHIRFFFYKRYILSIIQFISGRKNHWRPWSFEHWYNQWQSSINHRQGSSIPTPCTANRYVLMLQYSGCIVYKSQATQNCKLQKKKRKEKRTLCINFLIFHINSRQKKNSIFCLLLY